MERRPTGFVIVTMSMLAAALVGCTGKDDDPAAPTTTAPTATSTTTAEADLGSEKVSGIEALPVPAVASRTTGMDTCRGATGCREEYWTVANSSPAAVQVWYAARLDDQRPWRDWRPCSIDASEEPNRTLYHWMKPGVALNVQLSERDTEIHLRRIVIEMPCQ